jgi:hypothetical protein
VSGITALLAGMGGAAVGTVSLPTAVAYNAVLEGFGTASATYSLNSAGTYSSTGEAGGVWISPQVGMDQFEVRATLNSGTLTSGTVGAWLSLGTTRSWNNTSSTVPGQSANLTVQIRRIGDTAVLASATVTVTAEVIVL